MRSTYRCAYHGGEVVVDLFQRLSRFQGKNLPSRGNCISTDAAVELWLGRNGLTEVKPIEKRLPDRNKDDGSDVDHLLWTGGEAGTAVALFRVNGGGHCVPGGTQNLPDRMVGKVNRDFNGLQAVWHFFASHGRKLN